MRHFLICLLVLTFSLAGRTQNSDPQLNERLQAYMKLSKDLDFEGLMNYLHPKLFTIAPKEAMAETLKKAYDNDQMHISIDSMAILNIGEDFTVGAARYKKIDYELSLQLRFKDTAITEKREFVNGLLKNLEGSFPGKKVGYAAAQKAFWVKGPDLLFAIKDSPETSWMFLGYNKNPQLIQALFPPEVIAHFKLL